jgi:tetratricopeptide (TPR) repeat protein
LLKGNIIDDSYRPAVISLTSQESLEDFIYKLYDLGFSEGVDLTHFMSRSVDEKISVALQIIKDIQRAKEIVFVGDHRCIVTSDATLNTWFEIILQELGTSQQITFVVASSYRLYKPTIRNKDYIFAFDIPELNPTERKGLVKRYAEFEGLALTFEDYGFFLNLLTGYPEQVYYTVDLIKDIGLSEVKNQSHLIVDFNKERVDQILRKYENEQKAIDFLSLLAEFDFISYDFIFEIVGDGRYYRELITEFIASAICEFLGANNEYLRINDAIVDHIRRIRIGLPERFKKKLNQHLENFLATYKSEDKDLSVLFHSLKEALLEGEEIDTRYLIPSHFLKTMKELYDRHRRYSEVIKLADRVFANEEYMDENIKREIRYFLCLSLARQREPRFLSEVQKISGVDHDFLFGFYYRLTGRYDDSLKRLYKVLDKRPKLPRAKRELVQVLLHIEAYETALEIAKENYENDKSNPYHVQAYFNCLIKGEHVRDKNNIRAIEELLSVFSNIPSEKAEEMHYCAKAQYLTYIMSDKQGALKIIDEAIAKYPKVMYPKLAKFDIHERFNDIEQMDKLLTSLEKEIDQRSYFFSTLVSKKAIFLAKSGKTEEALKLINDKLRNHPEDSIEKIRQKISICSVTSEC